MSAPVYLNANGQLETLKGELDVPDLLDLNTSSTTRGDINFVVRTGDPSAPSEGDLWYDGTYLKYRDSSQTQTLGTAAAQSLDGAYDIGSTITVDAGAVTLDADSNDTSAALAITREPTSGFAAIGMSITIGNSTHLDGVGLSITDSRATEGNCILTGSGSSTRPAVAIGSQANGLFETIPNYLRLVIGGSTVWTGGPGGVFEVSTVSAGSPDSYDIGTDGYEFRHLRLTRDIYFTDDTNHSLVVTDSGTAGVAGRNLVLRSGGGAAATGSGTAGTVGGTFGWYAGDGGDGSGTDAAGVGGAFDMDGGAGGAGTASVAGGKGGTLNFDAGAGGADGGAGAGADGDLNVGYNAMAAGNWGNDGSNILMRGIWRMNDYSGSTHYIGLGNGSDLKLYHDGTDSYVTNSTGNWYFQTNAGGTAFTIDSSSHTNFPDSRKIYMGDGQDVQIFFDGTNFYIDNNTAGATVIQFDGSCSFEKSGNAAVKILSSKIVELYEDITLFDGKKARFGTGLDFDVYHDGTHAYVDNTTGSLNLRSNANIELQIGSGYQYEFTATSAYIHTSTTKKFLSGLPSYTAADTSGVLRVLSLTPTVNITGTSTGGYQVIYANVTETSHTGSVADLITLAVDSVNQFEVDNVGNVEAKGDLTMAGAGYFDTGSSQLVIDTDASPPMFRPGTSGQGNLGSTSYAFWETWSYRVRYPGSIEIIPNAGVAVTFDGTTKSATFTADMAMSSNKITGLAAGTDSTDAVNKSQLDAAVQGLDWQDSVLDQDLTAPPGSPTTGDRYIVAATATGDWASQEEKIAEYNGSTWDFTTPNEGTAVWVEDEDILYTYNNTHPSGTWVKFGSTLTHNNLSGLTTGDPHTQYILVAGTRAFSGDQSFGGNNITNLASLDSTSGSLLLKSAGTTALTLGASQTATFAADAILGSNKLYYDDGTDSYAQHASGVVDFYADATKIASLVGTSTTGMYINRLRVGNTSSLNTAFAIYGDHAPGDLDGLSTEATGILGRVRTYAATTAQSKRVDGVRGYAQITASNTQNLTSSIPQLCGVTGRLNTESGSSGTLSNAALFNALAPNEDDIHTSGLTVTNLYGLYVGALDNTVGTNGNNFTNAYGVYVATPVGTIADAFHAEGGRAYFGGTLELAGGVAVAAILDEDAMGSDSATALATQQSIKAYVDSQIGGVDTLAELTDTAISTPAGGHLLIYDGTDSWDNQEVTGDVTITSGGVTAIASGVIVDADISASAEIAVSKLADGAARQLLQTDAAGTGVEWTDNIDVPGTLDVTGNATFDGTLTSTSWAGFGNNATPFASTPLLVGHDWTDAVSGSQFGEYIGVRRTHTTAASTDHAVALAINASVKADNTQNWTSTYNSLVGITANVGTETSSTGAVTNAAAVELSNANVLGATITNAHGLYIYAQTGGTNNYGIKIETPTGTIADAIHAVGGRAYFGGTLELASGVAVSSILDEDAMGSDSATALATQQSIKAYVDAQVGGVDTLAELNDVTITTPATDHVLKYSAGGQWVNSTSLNLAGGLTLGANLAMGGFAITGVGNVDGRDVSADGTALDNHVAAASPHSGHELTSNKNAASGYAGLDGSSKLTGSQQVYGTSANTACEGNDSRLSDARTPTSHVHAAGDITHGTADQILVTNSGATDAAWASNITVPGTLAVTGVSTFTGAVQLGGVSTIAVDDDGASGLTLKTDSTSRLTISSAGLITVANRITGVSDPTGDSDAATKGYVDGLIQGLGYVDPVLDQDLTAPPGGESTGDRYIVAATATGDWAGHEKDIAEYNGSGWDFTTPVEGTATWVQDEDVLYVYGASSTWVKFGSTVTHNNLSGLTTGDPHTQYILVAGTRAFSGNQSFGGNNITNVGDINSTSGDLTIGAASATKFTLSTHMTLASGVDILPASNGASDLGSSSVAFLNGCFTNAYTTNIIALSSGSLYLKTGAGPTTALTLDTNQDATFAGDIAAVDANLTGDIYLDDTKRIYLGTSNDQYIEVPADPGNGINVRTLSGIAVTNASTSILQVPSTYDGAMVVPQYLRPFSDFDGTAILGQDNYQWGRGQFGPHDIKLVSTDALIIRNETAATATGGEEVQYSGRLRFESQAWETGTGSSDLVEYWIESQPATGSSVSGNLVFAERLNGGTAVEVLKLSSTGVDFTFSNNTDIIFDCAASIVTYFDRGSTGSFGHFAFRTAGATKWTLGFMQADATDDFGLYNEGTNVLHVAKSTNLATYYYDFTIDSARTLTVDTINGSSALTLKTGGTTALTLSASQNATFAGELVLNPSGTSVMRFKESGTTRANVYYDTATHEFHLGTPDTTDNATVVVDVDGTSVVTFTTGEISLASGYDILPAHNACTVGGSSNWFSNGYITNLLCLTINNNAASNLLIKSNSTTAITISGTTQDVDITNGMLTLGGATSNHSLSAGGDLVGNNAEFNGTVYIDATLRCATGAGVQFASGSTVVITDDGSNGMVLRTGGTSAIAIDSSQNVSVPNGTFGVSDTTESTTPTTGSTTIAGGMGVAKNVVVGGQAGSPTATLTDAATIATDCNNGNVFTVTLGGNRTLGAPSNPIDGFTYIWIIKQDATGSRTLSYNAIFTFPGGTAPTLSTAANAVDIITAIYDGAASKFRCIPNLAFA